MFDSRDAAEGRRNILERLGAKIPGIRGYLDREMRREVDKMQRDWLAERLDRARGTLGEKITAWTKAGNLVVLDPAGSADKALDRLANRIRHADYGYTGFFDAVKINQDELDAIYEFDLGLIEVVEGLSDSIEALPDEVEESSVKAMLARVRRADELMDERATVYEDVTKKGGR